MAQFNDLPDKILVRIFTYLTAEDIILCVRYVCTRWRALSENDEIWKHSCYCPGADTTEQGLLCVVTNTKALRVFQYFGTCNVVQPLSRYCRKLQVLTVPNLLLSAADIKVVMELLPELASLNISLTTTKDGLEITSMIGQSQTLLRLSLFPSDNGSAVPGLMGPIADGCPNLRTLICGTFGLPLSEVCYLLRCKKLQLFQLEHSGHVTADFFRALNECINLNNISFRKVEFEGPFTKMPPITNLKRLTTMAMTGCRMPMLKAIPLTLFLDTLPQMTYIGIPYGSGNIDELINRIIVTCPQLTHLDLEGNMDLRCRGLRNISCSKHLKYLDVSACMYLDKKAFKYVAEGCPELHTLDISGTSVSDSIFRQILRCKSLKNLLMAECDLTSIDLNLIPRNIPGLRSLHIGPEREPSDIARVLAQLKRQMPHLDVKFVSLQHNQSEYMRRKGDYMADCSATTVAPFSAAK
jgi:Leucine-rich repeat (LRR) protein